jgi:hypothetical protein
MFKLKKYDTNGVIPEALRDSAVEGKDGAWYAPDPDSVEPGGGSEALERTVKAVRRERDEAVAKARELQAQLADTTKQLETLQVSGQATDQRVNEMLAKWKKDTEEAVAAAVAERDKQLGTLAERVTKYELDDKLAAAFTKVGGRPERAARALVLAKTDGWKLVDGVAVRVGEDGQPQTISPEDYFGKHFRTEVPEFFAGTAAGGGGAAGAPRGAAPAPSTKPPTQWSSDERRAYIETNGPAAYRQLLDAQLAAGTQAPPQAGGGTM